MTTEDEARSMWCPAARIVDGKISDEGNAEHPNPQGAYNRVADKVRWAYPTGGGCIASRCMWWRWAGAAPLNNNPPSVKAIYRGYCGQAGKPDAVAAPLAATPAKKAKTKARR